MDKNLTRFASNEYANNVENHPYHRLLNRPALLSLVPELKGCTVLDAGCGTGWFTEYFALQGASMTGLDISEEMIVRTKTRVPTATVIQANLAEPLALESALFDLVLCSLSLQYLESWTATFAEFCRVLKPSGILIFSVHHPFEEFKLSNEHYFAVEERKRKGGQVSFRRSLSSMTETLHQVGFVIERLLEPLPEAAYKEADSEAYEGLLKFPGLLVVRARKNV
ncbi:MAG: class I SAM-dependent methyltransferase [Trueperaceae bacterium]